MFPIVRGKSVEKPGGGACASTHHRVLVYGVVARRQASSVARRAPSHSHVTPSEAAHSYVARVGARSVYDSSRITEPFYFY